MLETLLLNFLFLLFPVVFVLIFFENRTHSYNRKMLILLSAVTMILCIANPIRLEMGFIFDLRYIPFIIVALYGGYKSVLPLYVVLNIYRFYIGGAGTLPSFLYSTAVLALVPLFSNKFLKLDPKGRIVSATVISLLTMGCYLIILSRLVGALDSQFWILAFYAVTTHVGVMGIIMLLIEKIIANIKNRDRILQSERLNVVSELAASVSHEIRNPLTVTSGFLQLLNKSNTITPVEKGYIELSLQELNRAEKIVSDYLSFAKPQSENMVYSNMKAESEYTKNLILPYATIHQVEVEYSFNNSLNKSYDRNQIQQCLINLYKNGIEAMKDKGGGTLSIDISERKHNIIIRIQDTGIGMTKEEISRLGKPYYSTKEEGTGLGMLMAYSAINKVKGMIEVQSEKGKGTTFVITIPT
ncbi:two-component system sporulation sensor kinase B [Paenibacillus forsythiae]|uniref:histidine kinase n=1 Tax=Paenibacillus forsythiae TaxID=365616 RepID=A0ABU3H3B2_9BACL|nr:ATP-binding protein [Paenibacillus forsythiae]MDT3425321.1 two-component system sporulation sensor kinase B [Paenibacillus forsythiae]